MGKQLFTWLSLVVSLMASFVLSFFPLDALDEIWGLIETVSEGFLSCTSVYEARVALSACVLSCPTLILGEKEGLTQISGRVTAGVLFYA